MSEQIPVTIAAARWHNECPAGRWVPLQVSANLERKLTDMTAAKNKAVEALWQALDDGYTPEFTDLHTLLAELEEVR